MQPTNLRTHICSTLFISKSNKADTNVDTCLPNFDDGNADDAKDGRDSVVFERLCHELRAGDSGGGRHVGGRRCSEVCVPRYNCLQVGI